MKSLFVTVVIMAAVAFVACRPQASHSAEQGWGPPREPSSAELAEASARVAELAADDAAFSSVERDEAQGKVVVYRVGGSSEAVASALGAAVAGTGLKLEIRPALVTQSEVQALAHKLKTEDLELRASRIRVSSVAPAEHGGAVRVSVEGDASLAKRVLERRYPALAGRMAVSRR